MSFYVQLIKVPVEHLYKKIINKGTIEPTDAILAAGEEISS